MAADLQLQIGSRYSIASLIFFDPYVVFTVAAELAINTRSTSFILLELPSNTVMRKIGAAR